MIDYVTIVDGRVTALELGASALPESGPTTLYVDVTDADPVPQVDWYYTEPCGVFTEGPPVIPDGELAPPFPPGGTVPTPGDPGFPPGPLEPGPTPPPQVAATLVSFHANDAQLLSVPAASSRSDIAPRLWTAFDLTEACAVRLQAYVSTPVVGAQVACEFSVDNGATWDALDGGAIGPILDVGSAGDQRGPWQSVSPLAAGDVLLRLVVEGGDGSELLELGNTGLLVRMNTGAGGPCVEIPPYEPPVAGCPVPAALLTEDFAGFTSKSDWSGYISGLDVDAPQLFALVANFSGGWDLDTDRTFDGNPSGRCVLTGSAAGGYLYHEVADTFLAETPTAPDGLFDGVFFCVFELPADLTLPSFGTPGRAEFSQGLHLLWVNGADGQYLIARGDRVYLEWETGTGTTDVDQIDLGPLSDFLGQPLQLLVRAQAVGNSWRMRVYLNTPCEETPVLYADETVPTRQSGGVLSFGFTGAYRWLVNPSGTSIADASAWTYQLAFDTDPAVFGL